MSKQFECRVITPSGSRFQGEADYVTFPAWDGQYGVMAGMAPILSRLGEGILRIDGAQPQKFQTRGGFAHVKDGVLTILSDEVSSITTNQTEAAGV